MSSNTEASTGEGHRGSEQDALEIIRDQVEDQQGPQENIDHGSTNRAGNARSKTEGPMRDSAQESDVLHMIRDPEKQEQLFEKLGNKEPSNTCTATANRSVQQTANDPNEALSLMELKDREVIRHGNLPSAAQGEMLLKDQAIRASASTTNTLRASPAVPGEESSQVTESSSVNPLPRHPTQYSTNRNWSSESSANPGAYAIGGIGGDRTSNRRLANNNIGNTSNPPPEAPTADIEDGHGLPVANQVNDNSNLPVADMAGENRGRKNPSSSTSQPTTVAAILFVVACLVGVVMVIASVSKKEESNNMGDSTAQPATSAPSSDPPTHNLTSNQLLLLQSVPNNTLREIQVDPKSPQSRAYQWILQDMDANNYTNVNTNTTLMLTSRIHQRFALAAFFFATNGEEWTESHNWLNHSVHECFWFSQEEFLDFEGENSSDYIEVMHSNPCEIPNDEFNTSSQAVDVGHGEYQHLWLHSNLLQGTIPLELYWLTSLRSISVYNNEALTGSLSSHIGKLTRLEAINFGGMALTGTLPTELGLLSESLFSIAIINAQLEGTLPSELGLLTWLQDLLLDENQFNGTVPAELGNASNLKFLYLSLNAITGTIPQDLLLLPLQELFAAQNQFTGTIPTEIGLWGSMEKFVVYSNLFSSGTIPTQVGQMTSMLLLDFDDCYLSGGLPTELGLLTKMTRFWAEYNSLTAMIPSELGQLSNLDFLMLGWNFLAGMIPSELGQLALNELSLDENSLSGSLPDGLLTTELWFLDVTNNTMLTGTVPFIESLPLIVWVYLSGTQISGTLPDSLCESEILEFDCSLMLCGCDCLCVNGTAHDDILNLTMGTLNMQEVGNETRNVTGI